MESIQPGQLKPNRKGTGARARFIPTPEQLQAAIERGWTKEHPWSLLKWSTHYTCFYDTMVCGARPKVDLGKIKASTQHQVSYEQGWQKTAFKGGRSKLAKAKRGTRPWSMWRICMCEGDKHVRPGEEYELDEDGNPDHLTWDPRCPVATMEFVFQNQLEEDEPKRCYPNTVPKSTAGDVRYGAKSIADPSEAAVEFMQVQGLPKFDTNSGRKALARWCKYLSVPYELSVHIHGDLHDTWNENYETGVKNSLITIRKQSKDPETATAALRIFADWLGRGFNPYQRPMTLRERQNDALLTLLGSEELARNLRLGLPAREAMKAIPPRVPRPAAHPPPPPQPKKRKRPSKDLMKYEYKLSDVDSDTDLMEYMSPRPKKKRKTSRKKPKKPNPEPKPKKPKPKPKEKPKPKPKRAKRGKG